MVRSQRLGASRRICSYILAIKLHYYYCINTNAVLIQGLSINYAFLCSKLCLFMLANYAYLCSDYAQLCFHAFMLEVCHYAIFYARIIGTSQLIYRRSRGTALATNFGSLAPTHDSSEPQEVARIFHRQFSSTSPRTVIRPPLLLSSGSHRNRLFTRMYTCTSGLHYRPRPSTHGRNKLLMHESVTCNCQ